MSLLALVYTTPIWAQTLDNTTAATEANSESDAAVMSNKLSDTELAEAKQLPNDPKVNPYVAFKNTYRAKGPVKIYFSYYDYLSRITYNSKLNQLTIVTPNLVAGNNFLEGALFVTAALAGGGGVASNDLFLTKNKFVGFRIKGNEHREKFENPALNDIPRLLDEKIMAILNTNDAWKQRQYFEKIEILPGSWSLVYDKLPDNSDARQQETAYKVHFSSVIRKKLEGEGAKEGFFHAGKDTRIICEYESDAKPLPVWAANNYSLIINERVKAIQACAPKIDEKLPQFLELDKAQWGIDSKSAIRGAVIQCKEEIRQCRQIAKDSLYRDDEEKQCLADYKVCQNEVVRPLKQATPIGQCRNAYDDCVQPFSTIARASRSDDDKNAIKACRVVYDACVDEAKEQEKLKAAD